MLDHKRAAREPGWQPKLVATDLDGTYICHGHGLSPQHRADLEARRRTLEREIRRLHERLRTDALLRMSR